MDNLVNKKVELKNTYAGKIPKGTVGPVVKCEPIKYALVVQFEDGQVYRNEYYGLRHSEFDEDFKTLNT